MTGNDTRKSLLIYMTEYDSWYLDQDSFWWCNQFRCKVTLQSYYLRALYHFNRKCRTCCIFFKPYSVYICVTSINSIIYAQYAGHFCSDPSFSSMWSLLLMFSASRLKQSRLPACLPTTPSSTIQSQDPNQKFNSTATTLALWFKK